MKRKLSFTSFIVSLFVLTVSCQSDIQKADNYRLKYKFKEAAELYQRAADNGDAYAAWRLSNAYANGDGVPFDTILAEKWLRIAAEGGCEEAICYLALDEWDSCGRNIFDSLVSITENTFVLSIYAHLLFFEQNGYDEDTEKAIHILEGVKDKKNPSYLRTMAQIYHNGSDDIDIDVEKARNYYIKAFKYGDRWSASKLYYLYINPPEPWKADTNKAIEWLQKGVEASQVDCMVMMADLCYSKDSAFKHLHNPDMGYKLLKKAIEHGSGEAYAYLGNMYYFGEDIEKDDEKHFEYLQKAAELRNPNGLCNLGWCFINGTGCKKDIPKGVEMWKAAAENGYADAANNLFIYYHGGSNTIPTGPRDNVQAKKYLLKATQLGSVWAYYNIGRLYYLGYDLFEKNDQQAFIYMKKAADAGNVEACGALSLFYRKGIGVNKNPDLAQKYENMTKAKDDTDNKD